MIEMITRNKVLIILLIIIAIASFFRLWQLNSIPPGLYPDEAINGNEAVSAPGKIFYPENNGREGLFINLIALSFLIFGISIWSLKIVPAIIGILTVFGLYLLTRELFHKNIALLSSFFLAISFWHVNFSRIGFRGILVPLILVFAFYFLFRAFRTKKLSDFVFSGIFWGLGFYTYISFRMAILILIIILILKLIEFLKKAKFEHSWQWIWQKMYLQNGWWKVDCFILIMILVALPIGIYFLQSPGDFISRATGVSIFTQPNLLKAFGESLFKHLGMFNFYGDPNWRHNFAGSPQLFWPIGILFLIGFFIAIKEIASKKLLAINHWLLVIWFLTMLLPGILTYEGIPHALRVIGVIPVVYVLAGLGGWSLYQWFEKNIRNRRLLISLCLLFLIFLTYGQFCKYFLNWAKNPEVKNAFSKNYVEIGNYLNSLPSETQKYVIVNQAGVPVPYPDGIPMPAQTLMFIENTKFGQPQAIYLLPKNINQIKIDDRTTVIVPMEYDPELFDEFLKILPQGKVQLKNDIWVYSVN